MSEPRIPPRPASEWSDDAIDAIRAAFGDQAVERMRTAPHVPNVLTTMMRHPALSGPFLVYNAVLLNAPTLEPRHRELMILRVAWRTRSRYEWVQHVRMAATCGITEREIEAIGGSGDAEWSPLEADLLAATDQLLDEHRIDDDTWARLAARLDERQLIEVPFVVGTYTCLAMAFNSLGLQLDPDLHDVPAPLFPDDGAAT